MSTRLADIERDIIDKVRELAKVCAVEDTAVDLAESATNAYIQGGASAAFAERAERQAKEATALRMTIETEIRRLGYHLLEPHT